MSEEEYAFVEADPTKVHMSEMIDGRDLTIQFFIEESFKATEKGCTHWGTITDKSTTPPWKTQLVFYRPKEG